MDDRGSAGSPAATGGGVVRHVLVAVPALSALVLAVLLSVRTFADPDLGCHLAYGERFLDRAEIVDTNPFIYTLPASGAAGRPEPGPGGWYDRHGRYRFPNASWLSQVVMAAVHRLAGAAGLGVLQAALAIAIFAVSVLTMRRAGAPWLWIAPALVLMALLGTTRLRLQPEAFGYLLLASQLCVLISGTTGGRQLTWRSVAVLASLQVLFVNCHGYFLLGPILTGGMIVGLGTWRLWRAGMGSAPGGDDDAMGHNLRRLTVALLAQATACFANPWTWRLAAMPFQTLAFLSANGIGGAEPGACTHPWAVFGELFSPFWFAWDGLWDTRAYYAVLALAGVGLVLAAYAKRWGWCVIIIIAVVASLRMRRNIFLTGLIVAPVALAAIRAAGERLRLRRPGRLALKGLAGGLALAATALSWWLSAAVVRHRFWSSQGKMCDFGIGLARHHLPLEAARWINTHRPAGRLFADTGASANLHYFTRPHRDVPILTNVWAYPPEVLDQVSAYCTGGAPFTRAVADHGIEVVALRLQGYGTELARWLDKHPQWTLVHLDGRHVIFVRSAGPNAELARRFAITERSLDLAAFKANLRPLDPVPARALGMAGLLLLSLDWDEAAIDVLSDAVQADPNAPLAWGNLGTAYIARGRRRWRRLDHHALDDFRKAADCLKHALAIRPGNRMFENNLRATDQAVAEILRPASGPAGK